MSQVLMLAVTAVSLAFASAAGVVAWRLARRERARSAARIEALAAAIRGSAPPPAPRTLDRAPRPDPPLAMALHAGTNRMSPPQPGTRSIAAIAVGVSVVAGIAALAIFASGSAMAPAAAQRPVSVGLKDARGPELPLELLALGHERDGDRLTVRGMVRNPKLGAPVGRLTAVVFVFDRAGAFAASGRAPVARPTLAPGDESTFVVAVPGVADVARYRVSFRTNDRVVPHVDRRSRGETAAHP
jgi:hypothetical protein